MELRSPCGAGTGQIAYYYDGNIYTCDEGRMLAEMGNPNVLSWKMCIKIIIIPLWNQKVCRITCQASVLEGLPKLL